MGLGDAAGGTQEMTTLEAIIITVAVVAFLLVRRVHVSWLEIQEMDRQHRRRMEWLREWAAGQEVGAVDADDPRASVEVRR